MLGEVGAGPLIEHVAALPLEAWGANAFREEMLADSAHAALTDLFGPLAALPVDDPLALGPFEGGADLPGLGR